MLKRTFALCSAITTFAFSIAACSVETAPETSQEEAVESSEEALRVRCGNDRCTANEHCERTPVVCKKAPCPPVAKCVPNKPSCKGVRCSRGEHCELTPVTCITTPCYDQPMCVPDHKPSRCDAVRCPGGTHCEASGLGVSCVPDVNPCAFTLCQQGTTCEVQNGNAVCVPQANPCAVTLCRQGTTCEVQNGNAVCVSNAPFCGGIAGIRCPGMGTCADDPNDGCDPNKGGADCGGRCSCNVQALCIQGLHFDASPSVCACVR